MNSQSIFTGLVSGAICFVIGLIGATIITTPTIEKHQAELAQLKAEMQKKAQNELSTLQSKMQNTIDEKLFIINKLQNENKNVSIQIDNQNNNWDFQEAKLRMNEIDNIHMILFNLNILAINNGTDDTKQYHNHINKLRENHKFRLEAIKLFSTKHLLEDPKFFDIISEGQILSNQKKLEFLKVGNIEAFNKAEENEQQLYKDLIQNVKDYYKEN